MTARNCLSLYAEVGAAMLSGGEAGVAKRSSYRGMIRCVSGTTISRSETFQSTLFTNVVITPFSLTEMK